MPAAILGMRFILVCASRVWDAGHIAADCCVLRAPDDNALLLVLTFHDVAVYSRQTVP